MLFQLFMVGRIQSLGSCWFQLSGLPDPVEGYSPNQPFKPIEETEKRPRVALVELETSQCDVATPSAFVELETNPATEVTTTSVKRGRGRPKKVKT